MYDLNFVFGGCGFDNLPFYIERERLFNVSFEPETGRVKLYVLDRSERFLYKVSATGITRQYAGDDPDHGGYPGRLMRRLGRRVDPRQIVIDAVEEDIYYLYLDDAGVEECLHLVNALCRTFQVTEDRFLETMRSINKRQFSTVAEGLGAHAISLVKVPLSKRGLKIYSRPFHSRNGFDLDDRTREFLCRLYNCEQEHLPALLRFAWVARDVLTDRLLVVTQNHALLHRE